MYELITIIDPAELLSEEVTRFESPKWVYVPSQLARADHARYRRSREPERVALPADLRPGYFGMRLLEFHGHFPGSLADNLDFSLHSSLNDLVFEILLEG